MNMSGAYLCSTIIILKKVSKGMSPAAKTGIHVLEYKLYNHVTTHSTEQRNRQPAKPIH